MDDVFIAFHIALPNGHMPADTHIAITLALFLQKMAEILLLILYTRSLNHLRIAEGNTMSTAM